MTTLWPNPEVWKDVPGYEGLYQVSSAGSVRNTMTGQALQPWTHNAGYTCVTLCKNKVKRKLLIHRLVAWAFLPNPDRKPQVNHINGIKTDNRVENLEWCTNQENSIHSAYTLRHESTIPKRAVLCVSTGERYSSVSEAARASGACNQNIVKVCQGVRKTAAGLRWAYIEEGSA